MRLEAVLESFVHVAPLSNYTVSTLVPNMPPNIQRLLSYGVGFIGDGMVRTVDPLAIARPTLRLAAPIHASHSFPILTTAFGDVVTHWHSRLYLINSRIGRYVGLGRAHRLAYVIEELSTPQRREFLLGTPPWAQAVAALGVPTPWECLAYVPPLAVLPRGMGDLTGVVRTDLREHLEFLGAFYGPAQGRW